jgi:hypothetical protein
VSCADGSAKRTDRLLLKVIAFIMDYAAVDRIIDHLKLTFVAEKPPPSRVIEQVALMAAEEPAEYL